MQRPQANLRSSLSKSLIESLSNQREKFLLRLAAFLHSFKGMQKINTGHRKLDQFFEKCWTFEARRAAFFLQPSPEAYLYAHLFLDMRTNAFKLTQAFAAKPRMRRQHVATGVSQWYT
jgi:hypothetical protein